MPGGVLIFTVLYHTMHDIYKVHSEVTFFVLFAIFMGLTITGLRYSEPIKALYKRDLLLLGYLLLHYSYFLGNYTVFKFKIFYSYSIHVYLFSL